MHQTSPIIFVFLFLSATVFGQQKLDRPTFPKGNESTQREAIPFYNKAVDFLQQNDTIGAKHQLYKAFNISFDLVETQLLLGDIFYAQNRMDSALYFYKGAIDFAIEQAPHYYFRLFETAALNGEYDISHHFLKTFEKLYGKKAFGLYEESYPFTVADKEFYQKCDEFTRNFENWLPKAQTKDTVVKQIELIGYGNKEWYYASGTDQFIVKAKKRKLKKTRLENDFSLQSVTFDSKSKLYLISFKENGKTILAKAERKKRKWVNIQRLPVEINEGSWNAHAFYLGAKNLLYFSRLVNGNKDLYVAQYDITQNTCSSIEPLTRINTSKDEVSPYYQNGTFYFTSNGLPGFGGFDLYYTKDSQTANGIVKPMNAYNLGASFNTSGDEMQIHSLTNEEFSVYRKERLGPTYLLLLHNLPARYRINLDSHIIQLQTSNR
jgi:hypothetical protein